ncbi:hypothetical protein, conserved [Eimeria maxima]|uniref:Uncharacterized protein n=1 Tax=Eimeria maxima TaxID=5804 RepID=U6LZB5_EIMMA|nr:hypothetical protein, conserved [Eimeria maxima]CDJ57317.1 hypothetical protein, conserved [Eimeria maxima]
MAQATNLIMRGLNLELVYRQKTPASCRTEASTTGRRLFRWLSEGSGDAEKLIFSVGDVLVIAQRPKNPWPKPFSLWTDDLGAAIAEAKKNQWRTHVQFLSDFNPDDPLKVSFQGVED